MSFHPRLRRQPRRLPWPASRVDRDLLHELWIVSQETGRPITAVVAEAVSAHLNSRLDQVARAAEPAAAYRVDAPVTPTAAA